MLRIKEKFLHISFLPPTINHTLKSIIAHLLANMTITMPLLTEGYMLFFNNLITLLQFFKELFLLGQYFFSCMAASRPCD
jgi:hypothetical protein